MAARARHAPGALFHAYLPADQRVLTFILLGVMLLVISYTYTRLRDRKS